MNDDEKKPLYLPPQAEFDALVRETGSINETLTRSGPYQPVAAPEIWGPAEVGGPDEVDMLRAKVRELEHALNDAEVDYEQLRALNRARLEERSEAFALLREAYSSWREIDGHKAAMLAIGDFLSKFPAD